MFFFWSKEKARIIKMSLKWKKKIVKTNQIIIQKQK